MKANQELRDLIVMHRIRNWEVAEKLGISDSRFSVWLRTPLEEIEEIETAMAFRYGWEVPQEKVELTDDLFSNIAIMAEVFG